MGVKLIEFYVSVNVTQHIAKLPGHPRKCYDDIEPVLGTLASLHMKY